MLKNIEKQRIDMGTTKQVSFFISHPIQYFSPLFRQMAAQIPVRVYYFSDSSVRGNVDKGFGREVKWDVPLLDGYSSFFLKNYRRSRPIDNGFWDVFNPSIFKTIRKEKAAVVVVHGWTYISTLMSILAARMFGRKIWLRAENPLHQEGNKGLIKSKLKTFFLRYLLFPLVNKCLYIGSGSKAFFKHYGVCDSKLIYTPYAVDNEQLQKEAAKYQGIEAELKRSFEIPTEKLVILYSGKYIGKKNPLDLLKAFAMLDQRGDCFLVMMGEGVMRPEMEVFIRDHKIKNVLLTGFVNQSKVSAYYAIADVFVMCSGRGETWGLSVNEAMNFSKPVVVSDTCGCSQDLVVHGKNGFVFREHDTDALSSYISALLDNEALRKEAGCQSLKIVNEFSYQKTIDNFIKALEYCK